VDSVDDPLVVGRRVVDAGVVEEEQFSRRSLSSASGRSTEQPHQRKGCKENVQLATQYSFRSIPELLNPSCFNT